MTAVNRALDFADWKKLRALLERPIPESSTQALRLAIQTLDGMLATHRPDPVWLRKQRMGASYSLTRDQVPGAVNAWITAEAWIQGVRHLSVDVAGALHTRVTGQETSTFRDAPTYVDGRKIGFVAAIADAVFWTFSRLEADLKSELHPIFAAARFYQAWISIHPFTDANGRVGRLMMDQVLAQHRYPPPAIHSPRDFWAIQVADERPNMDPEHVPYQLIYLLQETVDPVSKTVMEAEVT